LKTYLKIYGPTIMEALNELQKIATEMPQVAHFHFMAGLKGVPAHPEDPEGVSALPRSSAAEEKTMTMFKKSPISKSGHTLGDYDFFFEWERDPTWFEMTDLISKIDKAFSRLG
jgi:hypothetical protein